MEEIPRRRSKFSNSITVVCFWLLLLSSHIIFYCLFDSFLVCSNGSQWKIHRKTASNVFTTRLYRDLVQGVFKATVSNLGDTLDRTIERDTSIDLQNEFLKVSELLQRTKMCLCIPLPTKIQP